MKKITMPEYILENALDSRNRETAMDRQIEYTERLLKWVKDGQVGEAPKWIPNRNQIKTI